MIDLRINPLREVREEIGLSQRDMALLLGVSSPTYCQAEKGYYRDVSHFEEKLKEMGILSPEDDLAGSYERWREEMVEDLRETVLERIK